MTPEQTREVAKALLDVASALQRAAAALADEPAGQPDVFTRCTYRSPFGGQCVLSVHDRDTLHACEGSTAPAIA